MCRRSRRSKPSDPHYFLAHVPTLWPTHRVNRDAAMILAIDTSTAACTAALFDDAGQCIAQADEVIGRGHAERLVPMIQEMLEGRAASQILVGVGPGSFTGIRVG